MILIRFIVCKQLTITTMRAKLIEAEIIVKIIPCRIFFWAYALESTRDAYNTSLVVSGLSYSAASIRYTKCHAALIITMAAYANLLCTQPQEGHQLMWSAQYGNRGVQQSAL